MVVIIHLENPEESIEKVLKSRRVSIVAEYKSILFYKNQLVLLTNNLIESIMEKILHLQ